MATIKPSILTEEEAHAKGKELFETQKETVYTGSSLGLLFFPLVNFAAIYNTLRDNNPELSEQAAAATAYFSMLAQSPIPTTYEKVFIEDWKRRYSGEKIYSDDPFVMIGGEFRPVDKLGLVIKFSTDFSEGLDAQTAYYYQIEKLQYFLAKLGLTEGIKKTLSEQSRKAQGEQASASAAKAAAAYAAAMAKKAEEEVQISREEAAAAIAQAEKDYNENLEKEAAAKTKLENIAQGLPDDFGTADPIGKYVLIGGGLLFAYIILKKRGK